jgi:hypothetical protein
MMKMMKKIKRMMMTQRLAGDIGESKHDVHQRFGRSRKKFLAWPREPIVPKKSMI